MKIHPAADLYPLLEGEEYRALLDSIRTDGIKHFGVVDPDGLLLDGRNRMKVCKELGIQFKTITHVEKDGEVGYLRYIAAVNSIRRHLDDEQLAVIASEMAPMFEAANEAKEKDRKPADAKTQPRTGTTGTFAKRPGGTARPPMGGSAGSTSGGTTKVPIPVPPVPEPRPKGPTAAAQAAKATGASTRNTERAIRIGKASGGKKLLEDVKTKKTTIGAAERAIKPKPDPKTRPPRIRTAGKVVTAADLVGIAAFRKSGIEAARRLLKLVNDLPMADDARKAIADDLVEVVDEWKSTIQALSVPRPAAITKGK